MPTFLRLLLAAALCSAAPITAARDKAPQDDPMPWLGPLPAKLNQTTLLRQLSAFQQRVADDLRNADIDLDRFVCKKPAEMGPIPEMDAVRAYLDAWPDSASDPKLRRGLDHAAATGNWLARVQLYAVFEPTSLAAKYRVLQLGEWMRRLKLGSVYASFGDALAASGYYSDAPDAGITGIDVYAALQNSYPAQNKVGKALSNNPKTAQVGRAMLDCAAASLPEYGRIFSGEAEKAAEQRRNAARAARLPPLHRAVDSGDPDQVAQQLAKAPGTVNVQNEEEQTALDLALLAKPPQVQIVALLIAHGARASEDHLVRSREHTQLGMAVAAPAPSNLELVKLLMKAGADPFATNKMNEYVFSTPFADAADGYEKGNDAAVFEFMLASGLLPPDSELATAYADQFADSPRTFDRLLAYGAAPSGKMFEQLVRVQEEKLASSLRRLRTLLERDPKLRSAIQGDDGERALFQATWNCRFDLAIALIDLGAPLRNGAALENHSLVRNVAERCGDTQIPEPSVKSRHRFLELLAARGYDLNGGSIDCVAWLPNCMMLNGEGVARDLLALGADPYWLPAGRDRNAVTVAISDCKSALAELMLAKPPARRDANTQDALNRAAASAADPYFCPEGTDMQGVLARLLSYGALAPAQKPARTRS